MQSIYPPQVLEDVNRRIDIRKMMHSINYKFDKYQDSGKMGKGYCPIHCEGLFRNLIIDKDQRTFRCLYTQCPGAKGGTLIELFAQAKKLELDDAVRALVKEQGLQVSLPVNAEVVEQSLDQAEAHLAANETEPAEAIYQRLLEAQPQLEAAHRGLMKVYAATGDSERRFQHLATLLQLRGGGADLAEFSDDIAAWADAQPDNQQARLALAELTLTQSEDPEEAIMEFMAAADACEAVGNIEGAIRAYSRVEQLSQERHIDIIDATPHIVRVYEQAGRQQEAVAHLLKKISDAEQHEDFRRAAELLISALEQEPDNVELRARFVEAAKKTPTTPALTEKILETVEFFSGRDDAESGIKALEGYVATAPDDERALLKLIDQYHTHGKPTEAGDTEARLARRHFAQGRRDEAIERVNAVLQWQPEHVESLRAVAEFQASTEQGSAARETRRRMAKALTGQRKFAEATEVLDSLIAEQPEATELLDQLAANLELAAKAGDAAAGSRAVSILEKLADQQIASTSGRTSLQYLERATALESTNPALLLKLASAALRSGNRTAARDSVILACEALAGDGKLKEAIAEAEQFTRVMPDEVDLQRYLAELHVRSGDKASAVKRLRRLADDLAARDRHNEAKEVFEQAQALMPENAETLLAQAELLEKAGNKEQLAATLSRAATMQEQAGDLEGAINTLQRVIATRPDDTAAAARIVQAYKKLGRPDDARNARLGLARTYRASGDFDREARVLRDALSEQPEDESLLSLLSVCEFARRDIPAGVQMARRLAALQERTSRPDEALATLRRALERAPDHLELHRDLFDILKKVGQAREAAQAGLRYVHVLAADGKPAEAASVFEQIVECDPQNIDVKAQQVEFLKQVGREAESREKQLALARLYRESEKFDEAEASLQQLVDTDPQDVAAREELALLFRHLGKNSAADEQLTAVAQSYDQEGEDTKALSTLVRILQGNPDNIDVRRQLIEAYKRRGSVMEAVRQLHAVADLLRRNNAEAEALAAEREATELSPRDMASRQRYMEGLLRSGRNDQAADEMEEIAATMIDRGKLDEALSTLNQLLEIDPGKLNARRLRAEIYSRNGEDAKALDEYRQIANLAAAAPQHAHAARQPAAPELPVYELQIVKEYDFERFVVGANNNFAYATALAVAKSPARAYNPLFLYADVGLGKTHLCNAIANYLLEHNPKTRIIYTNSEDFTGELVEAIQNNAIQPFRQRYRNADLLIVDDVQFLAGKERAQEEFFHIFNTLFQAKRQIVVTSDRPPSEIAHLESRLRSRFGSGVIVDIASPDLETRIAILNREAELLELGLDTSSTRIVAERVDTNVRDLKGALNQLVAMRDLRGQELNNDNVRKMLDTYYAPVS